MKKLLLLPLALLASNTFANELTNFDQISTAVMTGKSIRIAVNFNQCDAGQKPSLQPKYTIGIFTPNEVVINQGKIAASFMHFTLNDPSYPARPVHQFVRYTIAPDNTVTLSARVLDPTNYTPVSAEHVSQCKIGKGAKIYS